jgi:diacylglycerol kinase (ATP)
MRAIVIHNPAAGTGNHPAEHLTAILKEAGYSDIVYCLKKERRCKHSLLSSADLILIAGGDGTIAKVIRCLPQNDVPVAILPLGTANNIAHSIGLHTDPDLVLECLRSHRTSSFDLGTVSGPWGIRRFVEAVGFGSLADLMKPGPKPPAAERTKIGREMLKTVLADAHPQQLKLRADGEDLNFDVLMLEIMNTRYVGPGLPFGPRSHPGDGLLDVVYLLPEARTEMLTWIDNPDRCPPLIVRQARKVNVRWENRPLHVDDHLYPHAGAVADLKIRSIRNGIRFCVPPRAGSTFD